MEERAAFEVDRAGDPAGPDPATPAGRRLDPGSLPPPTISRRRMSQIAGLLIAGWLVISFGRQVAEAAAATDRAAGMRDQNAALREQVASLQADLARVQDGRFIELQARAHGLGGRGEIPFTLEAGTPTPGPDAPGAAGARLGAEPDHSSPLDGWLEVLLGP
jgi:hypothetical protein